MIALAVLLAASPCNPAPDVYARLEADYGEHRLGAGIADPVTVYELWTSESGSWTIVRRTANGLACIMASGYSWRDFPPPPPGEDG